MFLGEGSALGEPLRTEPPPLRAGRDDGEGAVAFQADLVEVDGSGELTVRQINVGEYQVGGVHPTQGDDPHPGAGCAGNGILRDYGAANSAGVAKVSLLGSDAQGVFEDGVREVDVGMAQSQRGGRFPARPVTLQAPRRDRQRHRPAEPHPRQEHRIPADQRPQLARSLEHRFTEIDVFGEAGRLEVGDASEDRRSEIGDPGEGGRLEIGGAGEGGQVEPGWAVEGGRPEISGTREGGRPKLSGAGEGGRREAGVVVEGGRLEISGTGKGDRPEPGVGEGGRDEHGGVGEGSQKEPGLAGEGGRVEPGGTVEGD